MSPIKKEFDQRTARDAVHTISNEGRFALAAETSSVVVARGCLVASTDTRF